MSTNKPSISSVVLEIAIENIATFIFYVSKQKIQHGKWIQIVMLTHQAAPAC